MKATISVTGHGKIERSPDTAKVSFSVRNESRDIKASQGVVSQKITAIKDELMKAGIDEKYIKTDAYNSYPQYDYPPVSCMGMSCPKPGAPTIRGYEVSHMVTVSIKDLEKVETVLGILGKNAVTDMNGPNFGFEDDTAIAREARDNAIADAKEQAKKLAKALGVDLGRIVSFSEEGNGYPMPMYNQSSDAMSATKAESMNPSVPVGVQNIESTVTVDYEIQ